MNPFALAYREQQQMFLFDKSYLAATFLKVGGLSTLSARFLVQFFWNPVLATVLTVLTLCLSSYVLWLSIRSSRIDWRTLLLCLVPSCFAGASLSDNSLHFDYLTSLLLVEVCLVIYKNIRYYRIPAGILLTIVSYLAAGPAALIFGLCACVFELRSDAVGKGYSLAFPVTALSCGLISFLFAHSATLYSSISPSFHYDLDISMPAIHWAGWISIPAVAALSCIKNKRLLFICGSSLFAVSLVISLFVSRNIDKKSNITGYEYEYYTVNEKWSELAESCKKHVWSPGTANYLNLASAWKGTLADDIMKYDNRGVSSLLMMPESKSVDVRVAHIMFAMGNMAAAQNVSYNALFTSEGYAPAMMKMNVLIELMRGSYDVAEKYLSILRKTLHYNKWAEDKMRFLRDDKAVQNDCLLGNGRKDFPSSDGFAMFDNPIDELMSVIEANPADTKAIQYGISFLLLSKDIAKLQIFIDKYWGSPALQSLPVPAQEAMIFYSEYSRNFDNVEPVDAGWCAGHGVSQVVMDHFRDFQTASVKSKGKSPAGYRGTYWNYLLYTQL